MHSVGSDLFPIVMNRWIWPLGLAFCCGLDQSCPKWLGAKHQEGLHTHEHTKASHGPSGPHALQMFLLLHHTGTPLLHTAPVHCTPTPLLLTVCLPLLLHCMPYDPRLTFVSPVCTAPGWEQAVQDRRGRGSPKTVTAE